jgi:hypothetical protein
VSKIHTHPDHMRRSGNTLGELGGQLAQGGQRLDSAGKNLIAHASGDKSGFGSVISKALGKGLQITGTVFGEGGRVVEGAGKRLHATADLHENADHHGATLLKKLHPDVKDTVAPNLRSADDEWPGDTNAGVDLREWVRTRPSGVCLGG